VYTIALKDYLGVLEELQRRIDLVSNKIKISAEEDEEAKLLMTIP